jgi:pyruvate/2-oxoglutarate/acetoin dehydrogenase E1 component
MTQMTFARAINAGLRKSLENDPKVVLMGEDIGTLGGVFRGHPVGTGEHGCRRHSITRSAGRSGLP